jgi:fructose-1,6-bisphosphatase I
LVPGVHNILITGRINGYPNPHNNPKGKLGMLYESAPMAMTMEHARGQGALATVAYRRRRR